MNEWMNNYGNVVYCCIMWVALTSLFEKWDRWDSKLSFHGNKFLKTRAKPILTVYLTTFCNDDGRSMMIQVNQNLRKHGFPWGPTGFCNTNKLETSNEWRYSHFSFLWIHHLSCQSHFCFYTHGYVCLINNRWRSLKRDTLQSQCS